MKQFKSTLHKTLFYNLVAFDFILLSSSNKRISNFFLDKYIIAKKKYLIRLSLLDLLKSFKRYIRLLQFIQSNLRYKQKNLFYIWVSNFQNLELLSLLFKKYKMRIPFEVEIIFPRWKNNFFSLKNILILDYQLMNNAYKALFFQNYHLIQTINSVEETINWGSYKIYNNLTEFKKLLFIGLILVQFFKK